MTQKSADTGGSCLKIRDDLPGIDAKMRKAQKITKRRKKDLDGFSKKRPSRAKSLTNSIVASHSYDLTQLIEHEYTTPSPLLPFEMAAPGKPTRGRPTIPRNFLEGSRNSWLRVFEENWAEVGFSLLEIRRVGRGTPEDIQSVFTPFKGSDSGASFEVFLQGVPQRVTEKDFRAHRDFNTALHRSIETTRSRNGELKRAQAEVENSLKEPGNQDGEIFRAENRRLKAHLLHAKDDLQRAERELAQSETQKRNEEAYWYCSQLLDFLTGTRRNAVTPLNLANALGGLPHLGWRASDRRCSKFHRADPCVACHTW